MRSFASSSSLRGPAVPPGQARPSPGRSVRRRPPGSPERMVGLDLFEGLTTHGEDGRVVPGIAGSRRAAALSIILRPQTLPGGLFILLSTLLEILSVYRLASRTNSDKCADTAGRRLQRIDPDPRGCEYTFPRVRDPRTGLSRRLRQRPGMASPRKCVPDVRARLRSARRSRRFDAPSPSGSGRRHLPRTLPKVGRTPGG